MTILHQVPNVAGKAIAQQASTTPVTAAPAQAQVADLATLQSQVRDLRIQLQGLEAQWDGLYEQLQKMSESNPARPGVQQAWADIGVQKAKVKGDIAYTEARIAQVRGTPWTTDAPSPPPRRGPDPDLIVGASAAVLLAMVIPISLAWARRIFRGRPQPAPSASPEQTVRLERMESSIDGMSIEIERILEGQRFVTKILAERPERLAAAEQNASPASVAPQPKALGAGPVEPIVVSPRERVRQSVTPH